MTLERHARMQRLGVGLTSMKTDECAATNADADRFRWARRLFIPHGRRPPWTYRYGVAVLGTLLFVGLELAFHEVLAPRVFLLLFPAVIVSSLYGGFGPGLLSGGLGVLVLNLFYSHPYGGLALDSEGLLQMSVFLGVTLLLGYAAEGLRGALESLESARARSRSELLTARRLAAIVESSNDAITGKDLDGVITSWNRAAERIYGYTAEEAVGREIAMLVPPEIDNDIPKILERIRRGERIEHYETLRRTKDGRRFPISLTISPIIDDQGRVVGASTIARDISAQREAEEVVRRSEERFRVAQDLSLDGFVILEPIRNGEDGIVDFEWTYANAAAGRIIRCAKEDLVGHRFRDVFSEDVQATEVFDRFVRVVETGVPQDFEAYFDCGDIHGWFRNMAVRLSDGLAVSFRDITERKVAEQEREALLQKARQAARAREEVLAVVSHDLRSPLSVIQMAARMLREGNLPDLERRAVLERQLRAVQQAESLVEDLLEVSMAEAGDMRLERRPVEPRLLVKRTCEALELQAEAAGVEVEWEVPPGLSPVLVDFDRACRILSNLLSNAIKFTPHGGRIRVSALPVSTEVLFRVSDTGPGIPEEQRIHLFDRFWQGGRQGRGGVGLGLAICKGLTEAHGGRIWVESRVGEGSTFFFTLPAILDDEAAVSFGSRLLQPSADRRR